MTKQLVTELDANQREALRRISRDIVGETEHYMTRVVKGVSDQTRAEKHHLWRTLYESARTARIRLDERSLYDVSNDVTQYGYLLLQENADDETLEGVRHVLALLAPTDTITKTARSMIPRDRPLRDLVPYPAPYVLSLPRADKTLFLRTVRRLLHDDSLTDALHVSRRDVHAARRDAFSGFVEATHEDNYEHVPLQETTLRLVLDAMTYATSRAMSDAAHAYDVNRDTLRFRDAVEHALSTTPRATADDPFETTDMMSTEPRYEAPTDDIPETTDATPTKSRYAAPTRAALILIAFVTPLAVLLLDALLPAMLTSHRFFVHYTHALERGVILTGISIGISLLLGLIVFALCLDEKEDDA